MRHLRGGQLSSPAGVQFAREKRASHDNETQTMRWSQRCWPSPRPGQSRSAATQQQRKKSTFSKLELAAEIQFEPPN